MEIRFALHRSSFFNRKTEKHEDMKKDGRILDGINMIKMIKMIGKGG